MLEIHLVLVMIELLLLVSRILMVGFLMDGWHAEGGVGVVG